MTSIVTWIEERTGLKSAVDFLRAKRVPVHRDSIWYLFGGLTIFFFSVQLATGILLLIYYSPTEASAHESVSFIMNEVSFGWLVRSAHHWSSHLMIGSMIVHLLSTYFMRAYRKPRELMWMTGILQFFLVLGFGFTGYLLPWDTTAYFATQIGTEIPRSIPFAGEFLVLLLRGGEFVGDATLRRLFALHVVILPLGILSLIAIHIILNQVHGTSTPIRLKNKSQSMRFLPSYVYRDMLAWIAGAALLLTLALMLPVTLGEKANPYMSAPAGIKPEWYFLVLFQSLKYAPSELAGFNGELLVHAGVMLVLGFMMAVPFLDRKAQREEEGRLIPLIGICLVLYVAISIVLAYLT